MPSKGGYKSLKEIRAQKQFDSMPVVIYTTSSSSKEIHECFMNGADSSVVKPDTVEGITKMIKELCNPNWINAHVTHQQKDFVLKFD